MKMLRRVSCFSIVALLFAGAANAPAFADTYQLVIHNRSFTPVSIAVRKTECMRRTIPPHHLVVNATWSGSIETETKENGCWHAWDPSVMVLEFSGPSGDEVSVKLEKFPVLLWRLRTVSEHGIRARLTYAGRDVQIELSGH